MKKSEILEKLNEGLPGEKIKKMYNEQKRDIHECAHALTMLMSTMSAIDGIQAPLLFLGSISAGLAGLAITTLTKEEVIALITEEYDHIVMKKQEYMEKTRQELEANPKNDSDEATYVVLPDESVKDLITDDTINYVGKKGGPVLISRPDGKVH